MPDHADWPSGLRLAERLLRMAGYGIAASVGLVVPNHSLSALVLATGVLAVVSVVGRWWHAEFVVALPFAWAILGLTLASHSAVVSLLSLALAILITRRWIDLLMFSMQVRAARRARVEAWRQVAAELGEGES